MSVNELQSLTQQFADAFDQRDLKTFLAMLSDDVEVFDHVPYRFDGKALFAKYLNEVIASLASASFGFRHGLHQTKRAVEDRERPLLCNTQGSLRIEPGHWARLEVHHDYQ
jgi:hypothetical protein